MSKLNNRKTKHDFLSKKLKEKNCNILNYKQIQQVSLILSVLIIMLLTALYVVCQFYPVKIRLYVKQDQENLIFYKSKSSTYFTKLASIQSRNLKNKK